MTRTKKATSKSIAAQHVDFIGLIAELERWRMEGLDSYECWDRQWLIRPTGEIPSSHRRPDLPDVIVELSATARRKQADGTVVGGFYFRIEDRACIRFPMASGVDISNGINAAARRIMKVAEVGDMRRGREI